MQHNSRNRHRRRYTWGGCKKRLFPFYNGTENIRCNRLVRLYVTAHIIISVDVSSSQLTIAELFVDWRKEYSFPLCVKSDTLRCRQQCCAVHVVVCRHVMVWVTQLQTKCVRHSDCERVCVCVPSMLWLEMFRFFSFHFLLHSQRSVQTQPSAIRPTEKIYNSNWIVFENHSSRDRLSDKQMKWAFSVWSLSLGFISHDIISDCFTSIPISMTITFSFVHFSFDWTQCELHIGIKCHETIACPPWSERKCKQNRRHYD